MKVVFLFCFLLFLGFSNAHAFRLLGPEAPKCTDNQVIEMVKQIVGEQAGISNAKIKLTSIRTTNFNKSVGSYSCKAVVIAQSEQIPVAYDVELNDSGDQFYVSLRGE